MRWTRWRLGSVTLMVACLLAAACGEDAEVDLGHIAVSSTVLDIGADDDSIQFIVSNDGGEKVIVTFSSAKFSVDPDVISLQPGEDVTVTVRVRDGAEREDGSVTLTGDNGQTVRVGVDVEADESTKARAAEEFRDFLLSLPLMQRTEETEFSIEIEMWGSSCRSVSLRCCACWCLVTWTVSPWMVNSARWK